MMLAEFGEGVSAQTYLILFAHGFGSYVFELILGRYSCLRVSICESCWCFVKVQISNFPGGTLIRKVGEKSFFWAMDCHAQVIVAGPGMTVLTGKEKGRACHLGEPWMGSLTHFTVNHLG